MNKAIGICGYCNWEVFEGQEYDVEHSDHHQFCLDKYLSFLFENDIRYKYNIFKDSEKVKKIYKSGIYFTIKK